MDMSIPALDSKILLESDPLKSRILVRRLAVGDPSHRLPDGVGTNGFSTEGSQIHNILLYVVSSAHMSPHLPTTVDYGESRHFCDDPVCPDPIWKLPKKGAVASRRYGQSAYVIRICAI